MKFFWSVLLILVLLGGLIVRSRDFFVLPLDAHPMRQTDTECVAYFLYTGKASFFKPKACLMRPVANTNGYFLLEMPFYEGLIALGYKILVPEIWVGRVVNLMLYVLGTLSLYGLLKKWIDKITAIFGVIAYSFMPGAIFFVGHAIHPDAMAVSLIWISLYFGWKYKEKGKLLFLLLSGLILGISVASRPFGLICLPVLFYFLYLRKSKLWNYLLITILGVGFYAGWRWWVSYLNIDMGWENWVLFGREKLFDLGLLKNLIWKNIVGETMGKSVSGLALVGLLTGIFRKDKKVIPLILWMFGVFIYWLLVPNGNLTHQYYADVYIPLVVILAAIGWKFVWDKSKILAILIFPIVIYNGVRVSSYHFETGIEANIDIQVAKEISKKIDNDKKIIYLARSNSVPLSLAHRQGWMLGEWPTDVSDQIWSFMEMRNYHFDYIVEPKHKVDLKTEDWEIIKQNYPLVEQGELINIYRYQ
jgi:hypothetical protein